MDPRERLKVNIGMDLEENLRTDRNDNLGMDPK